MDKFFKFLFLSLGIPQIIAWKIMRDPVVKKNLAQIKSSADAIAERSKYWGVHPQYQNNDKNVKSLDTLDRLDAKYRAKYSRK